jgi:glutathione S-transferase
MCKLQRYACWPMCLTQTQDKQQQAECAEKLTAEVHWLEGQADDEGPYFLGPDFSLVDATIAPWFLRQVGVGPLRRQCSPLHATLLSWHPQTDTQLCLGAL